MNGITAIQALSPAETWEAWQALMQASLAEGEAVAGLPQPVEAPHPLGETVPPHEAQRVPPAHDAQPSAAPLPQAAPEAPPLSSLPPAPAAPDRAPSAVPTAPAGLPADMPVAAARMADTGAAVLPMAPVLMTPLALQSGPELRWRVQDGAAWRKLFDEAGHGAPDDESEDEPSPQPVADTAPPEAPPWAQALLARLREAAAAPTSAAALRPALQAWRAGLPVLLASPAGLACLQPGRDAQAWHWRRWPARWRGARPATAERWWAVRLGLGVQGRPRTLRELAGAAAPGPGQVSCELRLDDAAPGIAQWTEVLVQAPASASLRALLGARPSLAWLLCNQPLWPQEGS